MADDEAGTAAGSVGRTAKMNIMRKINAETEETNLVLSTGWRVETGGCWAVRAQPHCVRKIDAVRTPCFYQFRARAMSRPP